MRIIVPSSLLKTAIVADAVVTGAVALLQVALATALADILGLPRTLVLESGIFLVAYALLLVGIARSSRVASVLIALIVIGNFGWALACLGLLVSQAVSPSGLGSAFVLLQVAAVLTFAVLEWAGLRASTPAAGTDTTSGVKHNAPRTHGAP